MKGVKESLLIKKRLVAACIVIAVLTAGMAGCGTPAKKPMTPKNMSSQSQQGYNTQKTPTPNQERVLADRFSRIATQVDGVKSATTVVQRMANGKYTVMVGLEMKNGVTKPEKIKKEVADRIKMTDRQVSKVLVTSDPKLVQRLKDIANGVIKGRPVSSFADQINELAKRIAPTMK